MELCKEHFPKLSQALLEMSEPGEPEDVRNAYWKAVNVAEKAQAMRDKEFSANERLRLAKLETWRTNLELCYLGIRCAAYEAKKFAKHMALSYPLILATFVLTLLASERYPMIGAAIYAIGCYQISEPLANLIRKRFTK